MALVEFPTESELKQMDFPDTHHLSSAIGWLELGNAAEALSELERISTTARNDAATLEVRWKILAAQERWDEAVIVARQHVRVAPDETGGWINCSFALHELRHTAEARAELLPAAKKFLEEPIVPYNLACYACQLGDMESARRWFDEAVKRGGKQKMKAMALDDPDLAPMKEEIQKL